MAGDGGGGGVPSEKCLTLDFSLGDDLGVVRSSPVLGSVIIKESA